jgi:hypothetical protein
MVDLLLRSGGISQHSVAMMRRSWGHGVSIVDTVGEMPTQSHDLIILRVCVCVCRRGYALESNNIK